ncbi:MAG: hypothetical protein KY468_03030 [Armatimonadetes bacterium]|nr:hypothetical protein [Armatimonadota bacterium]
MPAFSLSIPLPGQIGWPYDGVPELDPGGILAYADELADAYCFLATASRRLKEEGWKNIAYPTSLTFTKRFLSETDAYNELTQLGLDSYAIHLQTVPEVPGALVWTPPDLSVDVFSQMELEKILGWAEAALLPGRQSFNDPDLPACPACGGRLIVGRREEGQGDAYAFCLDPSCRVAAAVIRPEDPVLDVVLCVICLGRALDGMTPEEGVVPITLEVSGEHDRCPGCGRARQVVARARSVEASNDEPSRERPA